MGYRVADSFRCFLERGDFVADAGPSGRICSLRTTIGILLRDNSSSDRVGGNTAARHDSIQ
jgi:hypothetical protein